LRGRFPLETLQLAPKSFIRLTSKYLHTAEVYPPFVTRCGGAEEHLIYIKHPKWSLS